MRKSRFDRTLTINVARPLLRLVKRTDRLNIPILMYHGIRESAGSSCEYFATHTSPEVFASQMRWLRDEGYRTLDLNGALHELDSGRSSVKLVAITFDDGFQDFYNVALPILADFGFKATMFVISKFARNARNLLDGAACMGWKELRDCQSYGIEIGSHTATHPVLQQLSPQQVDEELESSRKEIEDELGGAVRSFSFPYAFPEHQRQFAVRMRSQLQAHGYESAVTTIIGTAGQGRDRFFLPRLPINSYDDLRLFQAKIEGAYNWLHAVQFAWKVVQSHRLQHPSSVTAC